LAQKGIKRPPWETQGNLRKGGIPPKKVRISITRKRLTVKPGLEEGSIRKRWAIKTCKKA